MAWWQRWLRREPEVPVPTVDAVAVDFPGWVHQGTDGNERTWTGSGGAMLNLNVEIFFDVPAASNVAELRRFFRQMAEARNGGLVEVKTFDGWAFRGIYKQPLGTGFIFTGMLVMPMDRATMVWTCVDGERQTTGTREATVAAGLFQDGRLTLDEYERSWAADPYDEHYRASGRVDSRVLRYRSDDEEFDERFAGHPLSVVRQTLDDVLSRVAVDESAFGSKRVSPAGVTG